ncbi:MAG: hypothetical protein ACXWZF_04650 [Actinomycetota bacterium]
MSLPSDEPLSRHPTELERAVKASLLGLMLGAFLRLVARAR